MTQHKLNLFMTFVGNGKNHFLFLLICNRSLKTFQQYHANKNDIII